MLHPHDVQEMCSQSIIYSEDMQDDAVSSRPRNRDGAGPANEDAADAPDADRPANRAMQDEFQANDDLDEVEHTRAPNDPPPFCPTLRYDHGATSRCVACIYAQRQGVAQNSRDDETIDQREQRAVFDEMLALINENYQRGTSNHQLVDMIHAFYEREVRPYWDCGEWDKPAIWEHILHHMGDDRIQCAEIRSALLLQIQALRDVVWVKRGGGERPGQHTPDHKSLRLMNELIKTHNSLVESAARRHQQSLQQQQRAVNAGGQM
ncbi:hypothetical protein CYMTET_4199 [Cymbomonas tetramitiformis]|uniref:Uncharacterized protein n=1 Tax=Cymbomonas tetramitiformis TaxID=36881 RepID=A0AAE0H1K1_9CHLO|nr:hypothetical protein CYMTET_4199 [Cymbomonas tetramitiformis]